MSFVNAHIVAYITDLGYSPFIAAGTFSLIGGCAILGALVLAGAHVYRWRASAGAAGQASA